MQFDHAARNTGDFKQIVHEPNEVSDLALHDCRYLGGRRIVAPSQFEQLEPGQQRGKWIAQLVTKCRKELILSLVGDTKGLFGACPIRQVSADLVLALA